MSPHIKFFYEEILKIIPKLSLTIKILKFQTPKQFAVIILKFEPRGSTIRVIGQTE